MAMGSIGEAFLAASSFLGLGSLRLGADGAMTSTLSEDAFSHGAVATLPAIAAFAPGESYFEAVAQALDQAGYLDA
ncbi:hypothetical protein [Methylobacterium trifolii]|uniref:Uncharacterized protein n=1 Tax=Methylobacterium trifolii TaxID=1003092 RepID=A0ABQ4U7H6_9HYPH|nr:hypothetical protein [Methylobacterium trifolii]GJE62318.1 hypothetical protein MPOCJGCO_4451 [Methylobacterium trifolii]